MINSNVKIKKNGRNRRGSQLEARKPDERTKVPYGQKCSTFQAHCPDWSVTQQTRRMSKLFFTSDIGGRNLHVPIPSDLNFPFT